MSKIEGWRKQKRVIKDTLVSVKRNVRCHQLDEAQLTAAEGAVRALESEVDLAIEAAIIQADTTRKTGFRNSDGCTEAKPSEYQRVAPLPKSVPKKGSNANATKATSTGVPEVGTVTAVTSKDYFLLQGLEASPQHLQGPILSLALPDLPSTDGGCQGGQLFLVMV